MKRRRKKVRLSEPIIVAGHATNHVVVRSPLTSALLAVHALEEPVLQHFSFLAVMTGLSFEDAVGIALADHDAILAAAREIS